MSTTGFYYLHTNGALIYKPRTVVDYDPDYFDSPFVRKVWPIDTEERGTAYILLVEAAALGARHDRIMELAERWHITDDDSKEFCARAGFEHECREDISAGPGWRVTHKDDDPKDQVGEGSNLLLALISYVRQGPLGKAAG